MLCDYQDVLQIEAGPQPFADINNTYASVSYTHLTLPTIYSV